MSEQQNDIQEQNETQDNQTEIDSWEAAFAALEPKSEETAETDSDNGNGNPDGDTSNAGDKEVSNEDEDKHSEPDETSAGGLDSDTGDKNEESGNAFSNYFGITEQDIEQHQSKFNERIRNQAINEIAAEFMKRDEVRKNNGSLGASINDPDICQRDEDGVPRFYNPDTGREFTGDNPRRQAQEWVDDYNRELARIFNSACAKYEEHLSEQGKPEMAVLKFARTYENLDPIRRGMLDNILEDYEIKDSANNVIGYSCDLDKALAVVDRQINMIQSYAKNHNENKSAQNESQIADNKKGPALDMKTSSGAIPSGDRPEPKSLAEAMERIQDEQLSKLKK